MRTSVLLLLLASALPIFGDPFQLAPPAATTHTPVTLVVRAVWRDSCLPRNAVVTREGTKVEVRWTVAPDQGCALALTPWRDDVPLGTFAAGVYEVTLRVQDANELLTLGTRTLVVTEAAPALSIEPSVVSGAAPTEVKITRRGGFCATSSVAVTVDGAPVAVRRSGCDLIVTLPARAAGPATVRITADGQVLESIAGVRYIDPAAAPDPSLYARVLIPVLYEGPGAFGSRWSTDTVLINADERPLEALPDVARPLPKLASRASQPLMPLFGNRPAGLVLFIPHGHDVRFGNLIRDLSRDASQWGTEVPVVRESDTDIVAYLPNVPFDGNYRLQLRLYGLDGVRAVVHIAPLGAPAMVKPIELTGPCAAPPCNSNQPAYASVDLRQLFPQLAAERVTFVVRSMDDGQYPRRVWGFVTVTNNQTQAVTVISPQ